MVHNQKSSNTMRQLKLAIRNLIAQLAILFCLVAWQNAKCATFIDGMYYVLNTANNTASLASATGEYGNFGGYAGDVIIPSSVIYQDVTYKVTTIQNRCFYNCKDITSITIPSSVTKISGTEVFYGCTGIKRIKLEDGNVPITIPGCVYSTQYGNTKATFHYAKLESIYVGRNIIMSSSFDSDSPFYGQSDLSDVVIGPSVTELPRGFIYGSAISNLYLPEGIKKIGSYALAYLTKLDEIVFPSSLEELGWGCCSGSSIEKAFVGDNIKIIEGTFNSCPNLKSVYLGSGLTTIGTNTFAWSNNLAKIYIFSDNLTSLNSPGFPDGLGQIFVNNPDRYKNLFPDKYLDKLIVFNNSTNIYTGILPVLNYQNYVENTSVMYSIPPEYINVGTYNINIPVSFHYKNWSSQTSVSISYAIIPAELMVVPHNVSRKYGEANPELTCSYFGFKNNENETVLTKSPNVETTATITSNAGTYPIIPSGAEAQNYTFNYERGVLTITKADQTIEWEQQFGTLNVGDIIELTANSSANLPIKYTSSDENIAEIFSLGGKKYVEFLNPGNVLLRATQEGNENYNEADRVSKSVKVDLHVSSIILNQNSVTLTVGNSLRLTATVLPENTTDKTIMWTSDNEAVATVGADGTVTAVSVGVANITAACGEVSATCKVTVNPVIASGITLNVEDITLLVGQSDKLTATVFPENTADKTIVWTSDNEAVATVGADGTVTAVSIGVANITAACGEVSAICKVTVNPVIASGIALNVEDMTLFIGQSDKLTATVLPENATDKTIVWTSDNEAVATVGEDGTVTAVSVGVANITAACGEAATTCKVTVNPIEVSSIELSQQDVTVLVGSTTTLTTKIYPENATNQTITWSSSDSSIASVDAEGVITGLQVGEAIITASCGSVLSTCKVTVTAVSPSSIDLNIKDMILFIGQSETIQAIVRPANTTYPTVTWRSEDVTVATVSDFGEVTGIKEGVTTITATCGEVSASCVVTVNPIVAANIEIVSGDVTLTIGSSTDLVARVSPENTTYPDVEWSSSDINIASITADGAVTAVNIGTAIITAKCGNVSATCSVTVIPIPSEGIVISPASVVMLLGDNVTLSATVFPETTTDKTITWGSDNPSVASVSSNGVVTALKVGVATITASNGSEKASCSVTVNPVEATSISLNVKDETIFVASSTQLVPTVSPVNVTDKTITWTSSKPEIATVSNYGLVNGVSVGTTTVTATIGNVSATCQINVVHRIPDMDPSATTSDREIYTLSGQPVNMAVYAEGGEPTGWSYVWTKNGETVYDGSELNIVVNNTSEGVVAETYRVKVENEIDKVVIYSEIFDFVVYIYPSLDQYPSDGDITVTSDNGDLNKTREGNSVILSVATPKGGNPQGWKCVWSNANCEIGEGESIETIATMSSGASMSIEETPYHLEMANYSPEGDIWAQFSLETSLEVYRRPETPLQMMRKGNGSSHTFIAMMSMSDVQLEQLDYNFVYGWTDAKGVDHIIDRTPLRYCHTDAEIFDNPTNIFWVYAIWTYTDGSVISSGLCYLDGSINENFDASVFGGDTVGNGAGRQSRLAIYTIDGHYIGSNPSQLSTGIYIITSEINGVNSVQKIIIR